MIKQVTQYGEEVLRQIAEPAEDNEHSRQVIQDLKDTLSEIPNGAGLAAPQIGESIRIFATRDYIKNDRSILIFVNPEITESSKETVGIPDGCLSIPNLSTTTQRNSFIKVSYLNENFEPQEVEFEGFQSVVFQHENDHLNGVLFIDRVEKEEMDVIDNFLERKSNGENVAYVNGKIITIEMQKPKLKNE